MKRSIVPAVFLLSALVVLLPISETGAKSKTKKNVILSTVDIKEDYEILGLVYYRSSELSPEKIHSELKKQAQGMGADYVIGLTYYSNAGYLYGSGTAVKFIEEDKSKK